MDTQRRKQIAWIVIIVGIILALVIAFANDGNMDPEERVGEIRQEIVEIREEMEGLEDEPVEDREEKARELEDRLNELEDELIDLQRETATTTQE